MGEEREDNVGLYLSGRVRTLSETSSESNGDLVRKVSTGVGYDVDGKFSFTKVRTLCVMAPPDINILLLRF